MVVDYEFRILFVKVRRSLTNVNTTIAWTNMKRRLRVQDNKVIRTSWEDNKDWMKIYSEREWKEMMDRISEIPVSEDNRDLPHHLVVSMQKKGHCR